MNLSSVSFQTQAPDNKATYVFAGKDQARKFGNVQQPQPLHWVKKLPNEEKKFDFEQKWVFSCKDMLCNRSPQ